LGTTPVVKQAIHATRICLLSTSIMVRRTDFVGSTATTAIQEGDPISFDQIDTESD
jgi:hypothetical protein